MDFTPVQREHVEKALADLDAGVSQAGFRDSTTYDVIHQGRPYPPKQLIALALKHATGRVVTGDDFGGVEVRCDLEVVAPHEGAGHRYVRSADCR